jgi:hypothetical protein
VAVDDSLKAVLSDRPVVLLSGGWDSALCAIVAMRRETDPVGLFIDYGQPYAGEETKASLAVALCLGMDLATYYLPSLPMDGAGSFKRRNSWLLAAAVQHGASSVYFGSRCPLPAFDRHGDSNWLWARSAARVFDLPVVTPATLWPKAMIRRAVMAEGITPAMIFSTEGWRPPE